jgi:polyferredoxin
MEIEREAIVQVVISAIALVTFVAATVFVAMTYSADGALTAQGGTALVGAIGLFVIVMLGAGIWLERQQF